MFLRCFICRGSAPEAVQIGNKQSEATGQPYSDIILAELINSSVCDRSEIQISDEEVVCASCSVLIEKQDLLRFEAQSIVNILRRLIVKRIDKNDELEFDIELDELVFTYFNQKKSKFFCKSCDFSSSVFESLAAHIKYHQIIDENNQELVVKVDDEVPLDNLVEVEEFKTEDKYLVDPHDDDFVQEVIDEEEDETELEEMDAYAYNLNVSEQNEYVFTEIISTEEETVVPTTQSKKMKSSLKKSTGIDKQIVCSVCLKTFKTNQSLTYHSMSHTNNYPFHCSFCNKGCKHEHQLKEHENTHIRETKFHCKICGQGFINQGTYHHHLKWHETPLVSES